MTYNGRSEFRHGRGMFILNVGIAILFGAGAWMTWHSRGWTWVSIALIGMTIMGLAAIVEVLILRIRLTDVALTVRDLRGERAYPKEEIVRIAEAKGSPPILLLRDGRRVRLPSVGSSLGNSVRAWLKD